MRRKCAAEDPSKDEDLHEIKSKKRPRAIRKRSGGVRLSGRKMSYARKATIVVSAVLVIVVAALGVNALFQKEDALVIESGYGSVSYELKEGEHYSADSGYTAEELFGRLNWKFRQHKNWYAEVHGEVDTLVKQDVRTYKQYDNGILISADVTKSAMVNAARQFCYIEALDRVVWREAAGGPSTYNGIETPWSTGEPYANMNINYHEDLNNNGKLDPGEDRNGNGKLEIGFKATCGLPAYELTVYVIDGETILSSEVEDHGDGTYTLHLQLDPKIYLQEDGSYRGATTYYSNQMKFTGGLTAPPTFDKIHASFTFDGNFDIIRTNIEEEYKATMGVSVGCSAISQTDYEFNTDKAKSDAYETYFKQYMAMDADSGPIKTELTATECLGQAFGPVLAGPAAFKLDLVLDGKPMDGIVYLDLHMGDGLDLSAIEARASIGPLSLWLDRGAAYVAAEKYKLSMSVAELAELISPGMAEGEGFESVDILAQLAGGTFHADEESGVATLSAKIALGSAEIPLDFRFLLGEDGAVSLGSVSATIESAELSVGAQIAFADIADSPAPLTESEKTAYVQLDPYVKGIYDLAQSDVFHADISYEENGFAVTGGADVSREGTVAGALNVTYGGQTKRVAFSYADALVCLDLDGVKISANVIQAIMLAARYLPVPPGSAQEFSVRDLLEKLFDGTIPDLAEISESENKLSVAIKGTELLRAFGVSFDLGGVELGVEQNAISAKALGISVRVSKGTSVETDLEGYIDLMPYVSSIENLLMGKAIGAEVNYAGGGLSVTGEFDLMLDQLALAGPVRLTYGSIDRTLFVQYVGGELYLALGELKLKLNAEEAAGLAADLIGAPRGGEETEILEKLFSFRFGDVLTAEETGGSLSLVLKGTELLQAFGVSFDLGDVGISVGKNGLTASADALGFTLSLGAGTAFTAQTDGYVDAGPVILQLPALLNAQGVSLNGAVDLSVQETAVSLLIKDGRISWRNGLEIYLAAALLADGAEHDVWFKLTDSAVAFAYGGIGAEIPLSDFATIESAIFEVYDRVRTTLDGILTDPARDPLPELDTFSDLLAFLKGPAALAKAAAEQAWNGDWTELVQKLEIKPSAKKGGVLCLSLGGFTADLMEEIGEGGLIALSVAFSSQSTDVLGELHAKACEDPLPAMPDDTNYFQTEEMLNFLGYLGSAVELFQTTDLTLSFNGKVVSSDTASPAEEESGGKYNIQASMSTHRGASSILHLDVDGKNLWVDADVFAHVSINVEAVNAEDNSLYIDLFILDGAPATDENGNTTYAEKDGLLDFYVTLSQFGPIGSATETVPAYNPVRLYAPSQEILTILSSALPLLGVDADILNDYLIEKWLSIESVEQLQAFGGIVRPLLSGLIGGTAAPVSGAKAASAEHKSFSFKDYFKELIVGGDGLKITLDSKAIYGVEGLADVQATLTKDADGTDGQGAIVYGKFRTLDLLNIYDRAGTRNTSLRGTVNYDPIVPSVPQESYQSFLGAEELILALAKSATHGVNKEGVQTDTIISGEETPHRYVVNNNFYIDGSISAVLNILILQAEINIRLVAISVSVDETGEIGVNVRLEYEGVQELNQIVINGDSETDITVKAGMVYIKRVQKTEWYTSLFVTNERDLVSPITLYRVMPLENFMSDMLNQLGFILNFGSVIMDNLKPSTSETPPTPDEKIDFGQRLQDVLRSYTFIGEKKNEEGEIETPASWELVFNGAALAEGILGDVTVRVARDKDGFIRDLTVDTTIVTVIKANVTLRWRNSGGAMEEGATDKTQSGFVDSLQSTEHGFGGMIEKLNAENGWYQEEADGASSGVMFLEGREVTVTYQYRSYTGDVTAEMAAQNVIVSTGNDGQPANTLYSVLTYPALTDHPDSVEFFTSWNETEVGGTLADDHIVYAQQRKQTYEVTFRSDTDLGDEWDYDETEGKWVLKRDMEYGASVDLGGNVYTITDQNRTFDILKEDVPPFAEGQRAGSWQKDPEISQSGAKFVPEYEPDTIIYVSEIAFTADGQTAERRPVEGVEGDVYAYSVEYGTTYTVETAPVAEGYTFLGWYMKKEGVWSKVEELGLGAEQTTVIVQALWAADGWITLNATKSAGILGMENYSAEAQIDHSKLVGAWANEIEGTSARYAFQFNKDASSASYGEYSDRNSATRNRDFSKSTHAHVKTEIVYTLADGTQFTITEERHTQM